jgi:hypothetical protein
MENWTLVGCVTELHEMRRRLCAARAVAPLAARWGRMPVDYPCLVAYHFVGDSEFVPAIVYRSDAEALCVGATAPPVPASAATAVPAVAHGDPVPGGPTRADHDRAVAAHLITVVTWLREVAGYPTDRYEREYAANLAAVDRWSAEDAARLRAGRLPIGASLPDPDSVSGN